MVLVLSKHAVKNLHLHPRYFKMTKMMRSNLSSWNVMPASSTYVAKASSFNFTVTLHLMNSQQLLMAWDSATEEESILNFMAYRFILKSFNLILLAVAVRVSPKSFSAN